MTFGDPRLPDRFWSKVSPEPNAGCWIWIGGATSAGYGMATVARNQIGYAHRFAYESLVGPIGDGLHVDHLCRVRCCVNPVHMELVSQRENTLRGVGFAAKNASKETCPKGHPYDEENTLHTKTRKGPARQCRSCGRARVNAYHQAKRRAA